MNHDRWLAVIGMIICCLIGLTRTGTAQDREKYSEQDVKAAFIYNMIKFTDWPTDYRSTDKNNIDICALGDEASRGLLDSIEGKTIRNKTISVRHVSSLQQLKNCMVLFISGSEQAKLKNITVVSSKANILTIGDTEGFSEKGVIINLYKQDNKIRFKVNLTAMEQAQLKISSNLLKLGEIVR
jgi:hypothetical protein